MKSFWRITLLGGLCVRYEDHVVTRFRTQKTAALLAYLALEPGQHPREVLMDLLWPESEPEAGRNNLSTSLSSLRRQLEDALPAGSLLVADRASIGLNPTAFSTDVGDFEAAVRQAGSASDDTHRGAYLTTAVELYKGELLPGFYDEWAQAEGRRLEEKYGSALSQLLALLEAQGQVERALEFARRGVTAQPDQEQWHLALMRLYEAINQPEVALRQYQDLKKVLKRERNAEPSEAARGLALRLKRSMLAASRATTPAPVAVSASNKSHSSSAPSLSSLPQHATALLMTELPSEPEEQELLTQKMHDRGGRFLRRTETASLWAFTRAGDAVTAALSAQAALARLQSQPPVRMALDTIETDIAATGQHGRQHDEFPERLRQLLLTAQPGEVLCGEATANIAVASGLRDPKIRFHDSGRFRAGESGIERLFEIECAVEDNAPLRMASPLKKVLLTPNNSLPPAFTRFFGREAEMETLRRLLLGGTRLITLTGAGGSGKTRLATETARSLADDWQRVLWFVPLADIFDAGLIFLAIRDAMRLPTSPNISPREQLIEALSSQPSLLILDNFEQLVEEGASQIAELLERVPDLTLLITSRQKLNLPGEREFPVAPLPVPGDKEPLAPAQLKEFACAALFTDRAQAARVDFQVNERNAQSVAALCRRLDGIPLAIELAAARALVLSPGQILEKLEGQLDFLETRQRGIPERHRTLRGAIAWSYGLLSPALQRFFARLSVFRGGWTIEAAEAVCSELEALDFLARLRECSLIVAQENATGMRFRMLETLREYAASQLAPEERRELSQRYFEYFLQLAENAADGVARRQSREQLDAEQDNFRAALGWVLDDTRKAEHSMQNVEQAARLVAALLPFWDLRGHYAEAITWSEKVLQQKDVPDALRARLLYGAGKFWWHAADFHTANERSRESLSIFRQLNDPRGIANALNSLAFVAIVAGDYQSAHSHLEESLILSRSIDDKRAISLSLVSLSWLILNSSDPLAQLPTLEESLALARELDDPRSTATMLTILGLTFLSVERYEVAQSYFQESYDLCLELGQQWELTISLHGLGSIAREKGDLVEAHSLLSESLRQFRADGSKWETSIVLNSLAFLALRQGQAERAATLLGAAERLRESIGHRLLSSQVEEYNRHLAALRSTLNAQTLETAWAVGRRLSTENAVALALQNA